MDIGYWKARLRVRFMLWVKYTLNDLFLHRLGLHCTTMAYFAKLSSEHDDMRRTLANQEESEQRS
jgi:hypothetical protein